MCAWLLALLAPAFALRLGATTASVHRAGVPSMQAGKLPANALVPRGTVSTNLFENLKQMQDQRVAAASHILLAPGKCTLPIAEAKALMEKWRVEVGGDREKFAELARVESHCPTADNGGDLGFLVRASCSAAFNEVLFEKEPGQAYGPIVTPAGLHLIFLASCNEPGKSKGLPWDKK